MQILLGLIFVIFLVNLIYLLILQVSTPQRFKEIINYLQIGFTIVIFSSYYLLPRLIDMEDFENADILQSPFVLFSPPSWLAGLWSLAIEGNRELVVLLLAALAILTPLICGWMILGVLTRTFNQKLVAITQGGGNAKRTKESESPREAGRSRLMDRLANWICK